MADNTDYLHTDKVMQFVVGSTVTNNDKNDNLPAKLRDVPFPPAHATVEHQFEFQRQGGEWKVNGVSWADGPEKRILAKPARGAVENWILKNGAGGWTHPVHIHLIDFQIVSRTGGSRGGVLPYEKGKPFFPTYAGSLRGLPTDFSNSGTQRRRLAKH